jgi:hypothetical protein
VKLQLEIIIHGSPEVKRAAERLLVPSPLETNLAGATGFVGSTAARTWEEKGGIPENLGIIIIISLLKKNSYCPYIKILSHVLTSTPYSVLM